MNDDIQKAPALPDGDPQEFRVLRDGDRDLRFTGWLLGEGEHGTGGNSGFRKDWTRGIVVQIYLTTGRRIVVGARRWSRWQGEGEIHTAEACRTASEALSWLEADSRDGRLGPASKAAWEAACGRYAGLEGEDVEVID